MGRPSGRGRAAPPRHVMLSPRRGPHDDMGRRAASRASPATRIAAMSPLPPPPAAPLAAVKALLFDVFGTVVDWRTSVTDELVLRAHRKLAAGPPPPAASASASSSPDERPPPGGPWSRLAELGHDDWGRFAQQWRLSYMAFTRGFDAARDAWCSVDEHHRRSLGALLDEWRLAGLFSPAELDSLSLVWHRLAPWPDAAAGLARLAGPGRLVTATLSNGNHALLRDLADYGALPFGRLFSAESFGVYKPSPDTYLGAVAALGLRPDEAAMVAAHLPDLEAARACGLRTVYVERPGEETWGEDEERHRRAREWVDVWISHEAAAADTGGFVELARRLWGPSPPAS